MTASSLDRFSERARPRAAELERSGMVYAFDQNVGHVLDHPVEISAADRMEVGVRRPDS